MLNLKMPENLPPTSAAAKYHSLRTYNQIQVWKDRTDLTTEEWGWAVKENRILGIHTDHSRLLSVVRCKCNHTEMSH